MITARRLATVLTAAMVATVLAACQPTPDKDAFYTPPSSLPSTNGAIIRSRASTFTLDPVNRLPVPATKAWQVLYRSTSATGGAMAVSGTVIVPTTPWIGVGSRPLVSYAVGTRGVGDACAPSYTLAHGTDYEGAFIATALAKGWAVAVTDYEGLGTPGTHTYVVGQSEGRAVLDIARAAQRLSGTGLSANSPVGIMGYSQGGGAAAWAGQLAPTYAPDLKVRGVAAGGVPADLNAVAAALDGSPFVALALLASIGLDAAYPELKLANYLNSRGWRTLQKANELCIASFDGITSVIDTAFTRIDQYVTTNPLTTPAWQARLNQNKLGSAKPAAPVFLFHALADQMVAYPQAATLRRTWCNRGATVTWTTLPLAEHVKGMVDGAPLAFDWLSARFAGLPATGNCLLP
jgi:hypothetical protein